MKKHKWGELYSELLEKLGFKKNEFEEKIRAWRVEELEKEKKFRLNISGLQDLLKESEASEETKIPSITPYSAKTEQNPFEVMESILDKFEELEISEEKLPKGIFCTSMFAMGMYIEYNAAKRFLDDSDLTMKWYTSIGTDETYMNINEGISIFFDAVDVFATSAEHLLNRLTKGEMFGSIEPQLAMFLYSNLRDAIKRAKYISGDSEVKALLPTYLERLIKQSTKLREIKDLLDANWAKHYPNILKNASNEDLKKMLEGSEYSLKPLEEKKKDSGYSGMEVA